MEKNCKSGYYYHDKRSFTRKLMLNEGFVSLKGCNAKSRLFLKCLDKFWMFNEDTYIER